MAWVERSHPIRPIDLITLEVISKQVIFEQVEELLKSLEPFCYILLEQSA